MESHAERATPVALIAGAPGNLARGGAGPANWANDLASIAPSDWNFDLASHFLERAGFGGTPEEIGRLAAMSPAEAVASLLDYRSILNDLPPFDPSGVWDPSLRDFPPSRPAATESAEKTGEVR